MSEHTDTQAVDALPENREAEAPAGASALDTDASDVAVRLAEAEAKRDEYLADLRRVAADFDNYRKRAQREQELLVTRAHERLVGKLLPVLDDLERALEAAEQHEEATVLEGVRMTRDALAGVLAGEGVTEIEANGRFDPHVHEALMTMPTEAAESGAVVQVVQKGYLLGDAVLRPARVIVAE